MIQSINTLAKVVHEYYVGLVEQGFTTKQAFELTVQYQKDFLAMANPKPNKP
jgi:hypothetical protein